MSREFSFETLQLHAGQTPDKETKSRAVPIYQTTSYVFDDAQEGEDLFALRKPGNIYTRITNPTVAVLEERIAALEGGVGALATASGMAAITYAVLGLAHAGDHVVAATTLYGGTFNLLKETLPRYGVTTTFVDVDNPEEIEAAIKDNTKLVLIESLGNPLINIPDFEKIADYSLFSVLDGQGSLLVDGQEYPIAKGVHFILPSDVQAWEIKGDLELIVSHP